MANWWARRDQLDEHQLRLIDELEVEGRYLVLGPPGSGKTNVLLRRAQFFRTQRLPNSLVLTFTRSLTEFLRTGCYNASNVELFPPDLITTYETWIREMFRRNATPLPPDGNSFLDRRRRLASEALTLLRGGRTPKYDALFIDEAQDLLPEEVELIANSSDRLFFVGDDRQRIHGTSNGLDAVRAIVPTPLEETLPFHYRLASEICEMADRILVSVSGETLAQSSHYNGPTPARIDAHHLDRDDIIPTMLTSLQSQYRVYEDLLREGDRLGIIVPRRDDRELVMEAIENTPGLAGKAQIVRARTGDSNDRDHVTALDPSRPILILTEKGCKGLEFRALHWLYVDENATYRTDELYYTVVTRAKTSLDMYHSSSLPPTLARAYAAPAGDIWV
ncbi:AAA family ATPase [Rhizobium leguminosarum]|uniref:AAA family ATPase n=1 Tax=Rhizobium leguminosarum TaxID=384 RepID=UPI003F9B4BA4